LVEQKMAEDYKAQDEKKIEQEFLKGTKDQNLGVYTDIFSAKTGIDGQDGGAVTSLLIKGLNDGTFDAVIVVQRREGYSAEAVATENPDEVMAARGTKYLKVSIISKLRELASQGKRRIAIVCTPCEARAARKMQQTLKQKFSDLEITIIGLFCFEAFNPAKLKEEITRLLDVDLDKAEKTQIRKGKFTAHIEGQEYSCKVKELNNAAEKACHYCDDFTSKLADISVGSVGSQNGYSTVIVRSDKGKKLLENLDAAKAGVEKEEIIKLSKFKAERAKKSFANLKNQQ
jgi:coenzyme F420-reducing hydrogenase beta subunit